VWSDSSQLRVWGSRLEIYLGVEQSILGSGQARLSHLQGPLGTPKSLLRRCKFLLGVLEGSIEVVVPVFGIWCSVPRV